MAQRCPPPPKKNFQSHIVDKGEVLPEMVEVCGFHEETVDIVRGAANDVAWIKRISWAVLVTCASLIVSIWSIFFPMISSIHTKLSILESRIAVNSQKIAHLELTDEESKSDRKELRKCAEEGRADRKELRTLIEQLREKFKNAPMFNG